MPPEPVAQPKRGLEVHSSASIRFSSQRCAAQSLLTHISAEAIRNQLSSREADAINGDAIAKR
jgi:hypothetical protein